MKSFAIIPAAGLGQRFGAKKQFLKLQGQSILSRVVSIFEKFDQIVVSLPTEDLEEEKKKDWPANVIFAAGGKTRAESVYKAFSVLDGSAGDCVLVHDGVRPCVSKALVLRVLEGVTKYGVVVPGISIHDTVKEIKGNQVVKTIEREKLRAIQTPQGFEYSLLKKIYSSGMNLGSVMTDEAKMAEELGLPVFVVEGESANIKVTTPDDLKLAEMFLKNASTSSACP